MVAQELELLADPSKHAEAAKVAVDMQLQVLQASEAAQQVPLPMILVSEDVYACDFGVVVAACLL